MCSRKWLTPETSSVSSRAPVCTKNPMAVVCASGLHSATTCKPFGRVRLRNCNGNLQRLGAKRHDREITRRMAGQKRVDALARKSVQDLAELVERAHAPQVIPISRDGAGS